VQKTTCNSSFAEYRSNYAESVGKREGNQVMQTARAELRTAAIEWRSTNHFAGQTRTRHVRASINLAVIPYAALFIVALAILRAAWGML
jgi:hypothetical protein